MAKKGDRFTRVLGLLSYADEKKRMDKFSGDIEGNRSEFERLTKEYEMAYRDVARKVLEVDNELNKKFKLLGEAVLKLKEER